MGNIIYMRLYLLRSKLPLVCNIACFCRCQSMQDKLSSAGTVKGSSLRIFRQRCPVLWCYTAANSSIICCRVFSTESVTLVAYLSIPGAAFAMA